MQKKRNTISENKFFDILAVIVCLGGMSVSLFLFWKDLNISFTKQNEEPIGMVYFKYNTVQRRLSDYNVWERLQKSSPIYNGDRVRTGNYSEAFTIFSDGSRLDLHENTLVQLFNTENQNSVEFVKGAVSVSSTAKKDEKQKPALQVIANSHVLTFSENTSAIISSKPTTQSKSSDSLSDAAVDDNLVVVTAGSVEISEQQEAKPILPIIKSIPLIPVAKEPVPEKTLLEAGSTLVVAKVEPETNTNPVVEDIFTVKATIYSPSSTYTLSRKDKELVSVSFFWESNVPLRIEFAEDANFSPILSKNDLPQNATKTSVALDFINDEDTVYWRIVSAENQKIDSGIIFIREIETAIPSNELQSVFGTEKAQSISEIIEQSNEELTVLQESVLKEAESLVAVAEPVQEESVQEELLPPMEVEEPAIVEPVKVVEEQKVEVVPPKPVVAPPKPAPAKPAATSPKPAPAKTVAPPAKVAPTPPPAPAKPVEVIPELVDIAPSLKSPANGNTFTEDFFAVDVPKIDFSWAQVKGATSYTFTLYKNSVDGEKLLTKKLKSPSFTLEGDNISCLDNGDFAWTVIAETSSNGKIYESKSAVQTFTVNLSNLESIEMDDSTLIKN